MPAKKAAFEKVQSNVTDQSLLLETLWGRCVFETYRDSDKDGLHYFNYLHDLIFTCLGQWENLTEDCMKNAVNWVGADIQTVQKCVDFSWNDPFNNQTDNSLYYEDKTLAEVYGVAVHPAITINGQLYRGDLTGEDIFRAICASLSGRFKPIQCSKEYNVAKEIANSEVDFINRN